ncbi:MAG: hypothetical protein ABJC26_07965 [Gemmatimonadaceae bacterium]
MNDILQQSIAVQVLVLLVLSAVVACVAWTVTHEEVFREVHDFCMRKSKSSRNIVVRKFFYLFTCEYCFSHYVAATVVIAAHYRLLVDDWRGFIAAVFVIVWIANFQMAAFARLRLEVKLERIEIDEKADENGQNKVTDSRGNSASGSSSAATKP